MKARHIILTAIATTALAAPVAEAAGKNQLQCSTTARAKVAQSANLALYNPKNPRGLQSSGLSHWPYASSCKASVKPVHVTVNGFSLTGSLLGTDAGQASAKASKPIQIQSVPAVVVPAANVPSLGVSPIDGSFSDSYFDTSSVDNAAVAAAQTDGSASDSTPTTPDLQDGYLLS